MKKEKCCLPLSTLPPIIRQGRVIPRTLISLHEDDFKIYCANIRKILFGSLSFIDTDLLNLNENEPTEILLYGISNYNVVQNKNIKETINFILKSNELSNGPIVLMTFCWESKAVSSGKLFLCIYTLFEDVKSHLIQCISTN